MHTYALPGGRALVLAENDVARVRVNDYRSRLDPNQPDVLNSYRAKVTAITDDHRVQITWRAKARPSSAASGGVRVDRPGGADTGPLQMTPLS
ncbi:MULTISPECIES: hypothetical protein [unclassified Streptomyces]|uniref:hypothetical protein n=1 Tax=unclassified Streptomyces TaxID=2593676 RepID=UPI0033A3493D